MNPKFSFKEILFTTIIGGLIIGFALWQGQKELNERSRELQETKTEWKVIEGEKVTVYPKNMKFIFSDPNKVTVTAPKEEWETITMKVTAYCPCEVCCEQWADIPVSSGKRKTASGHTISNGDKFVAAPRIYSFGTEMVIEGYAGGNVVKVEDIGGAIKGNKLDLYFDSHKTSLIWGVRYVEVKVKM